MTGEVPPVLQDDLGKDFYMAVFDTFDEVKDFESYVLEKKGEKPAVVEDEEKKEERFPQPQDKKDESEETEDKK